MIRRGGKEIYATCMTASWSKKPWCTPQFWIALLQTCFSITWRTSSISLFATPWPQPRRT